MIEPGKYQATATGYEHGVAKTGTEFIRIYFRICTPGPSLGYTLSYDGWFTAGALKQTLRAMANAGWDERSLATPEGLGSVECELDVEHEESEDGEKMYPRIKWVNAPFRLPPERKMPESTVESLDGRLQAYRATEARRAAGMAPASGRGRGFTPAPSDDDDIPF